MSVILDIATAVPEFAVSKAEVLNFYNRSLEALNLPDISKKLHFISEKTQITGRFSCIPDFKGQTQELYNDNNYRPSVERRMRVYKEKIVPLASKSINKLLRRNDIEPAEISHLITVSCTGLFAPGLEFAIADQLGLQHTEKLALNFLGCYAAIKALKHAHYIAEANPKACILIVSAELCSLHFIPSVTDEDIIANLLFSDGAAATIVCGTDSPQIENKVVLNIDTIGSATIPHTADLMTWDISSSAFRMYLSKHLVKAIKETIHPVISRLGKENKSHTDYWAIHPGGMRILDAVKESLQLHELHIEDSKAVLKQYGNMSSPTILFILSRILQKIRIGEYTLDKNIVVCGFGPGLTVEMMQLQSVQILSGYSYISKTLTDAVQV